MTITDQAVHDDELREQAKKRLEGQQGFKLMLGIFAISLAVVTLNWALAGGGYFYPGLVLLGMSTTALIFGWFVYGPRKSVPDSKVDQEVLRMKGE